MLLTAPAWHSLFDHDIELSNIGLGEVEISLRYFFQSLLISKIIIIWVSLLLLTGSCIRCPLAYTPVDGCRPRTPDGGAPQCGFMQSNRSMGRRPSGA